VVQFFQDWSLYYDDKGEYPVAISPITLGTTSSIVLCDNGFVASASSCSGKIYMGKIPRNPSPNGIDYSYVSTSGSGTYSLAYLLEKGVETIPSGYNIVGEGDTLSYGLVAYYPLNGTHLASDISGNNNNGTIYGATLTTGVNGEINGAYDFGTANDGFYIDIPNNNFSFYNFSMSAWIYIKGNQLNYDGTIISSGNWNSSHWSFGISQANGSIKTRNPYATVNYAFSLNNWYHLVYVRDSNVLKFFVNGVLINSYTNNNYIPLTSGYTNTKIGMDTYTLSYFNFNGKIALFRMYNRALNSIEIMYLYNKVN